MSKFNLIRIVVIAMLFSSCNIVRPFFIKNTKKEERKEKRVEKKNERKSVKGNLITVEIDSSSLVKKDSLRLKTNDTLSARKIINLKKLAYNTFQCKAKMHFEGNGQKQSFNANFRLEKGKSIWVSINAPIIGEVARALITPDSVKAIERINKHSYLYSYKDIEKIINLEVDFNTLQDLIIGNAIATEGEITDIKELGSFSTIFIKGTDYVNQLTYNKVDSTLKQLQLQTNRAVSSSSILIAYSQYTFDQTRSFSSMRTYHIQDVKGAAELIMDVNKFDFDQAIDFPFSIPSSYKLQK